MIEYTSMIDFLKKNTVYSITLVISIILSLFLLKYLSGATSNFISDFAQIAKSFATENPEKIYFFAFLAAVIEGTIVLALVPGSMFILGTGVLAATGAVSIHILYPVVVLGAFMGDNVGYIIGKYFGSSILKRGVIGESHHQMAKDFIKKHGIKSIFFSRFTSGMKELAPFVAGSLRMNRKKFLIGNLAGGFFWAALWLGAGYFFSHFIDNPKDIAKGIGIMGGVVFISFMFSLYLLEKGKTFKDLKKIKDES